MTKAKIKANVTLHKATTVICITQQLGIQRNIFFGEGQIFKFQNNRNKKCLCSTNSSCFREDVLFLRKTLSGNETVRADQLQKGDFVVTGRSGENEFAQVLCVLKTKCPSSTANFCNVGENTWITARHPVKVGEEWYRAKALYDVEEQQCEYVFNFILDKEHTILGAASGRIFSTIESSFFIYEDKEKTEVRQSNQVELEAELRRIGAFEKGIFVGKRLVGPDGRSFGGLIEE